MSRVGTLSFELAAMILLIAAPTSVGILVLWARVAPDPDQAIHGMLRRHLAQTVFLFDGEDLVDCTPSGKRLMHDLGKGGPDLQRLLRGLSPRFAGLPKTEDIQSVGLEGTFFARDPLDDLRLQLENWNGLLRASLVQSESENGELTDELAQVAQSDELVTLRAATDTAPFLMWRTNAEGQIDWANEAYVALLKVTNPEDALYWPPKELFPGLKASRPTDRKPGREMLETPEGSRAYEIHHAQNGQGWIHFATPVDALMKAERTQREFVQTLTKTFAHLSIGLAIFDRQRQLTLFNPALLDLMHLPVDFLALRPTLNAFLDRLRQEQRIPEPKDYKAWRKQLVELEDQAVNGSYCETWSLPGGVTFRVTGRPHPDGAIAFLFEDISAEMSLTRRFHSEVELGHAALDAVEEAIMLVSNTGSVTLTNNAYRELWGEDLEGSLVVRRLSDIAREWRELSEDTPVWDSLLASIERRDGSPNWHGELVMKDGRALYCRTQRLTGGAVLVGFKTAAPLVSSRLKKNTATEHPQSA